MVSAACRRRDAQEASPIQKDRCPSARFDWGFPAGCGGMLLEGRSGVTRMPSSWLAVTQGPSRNTDGAAIGEADATRESVFCRSAGRPAKSLVQEAGATCRIVCTPPHVAEAKRPDAGPQDGGVWSADRDAGAVTEHWRRRYRRGRCYARVSFWPKRGTPGKNLLCRRPEPPAPLSGHRRMLRKRQARVAAGSSRVAR